jgi:hypothetical protein
MLISLLIVSVFSLLVSIALYLYTKKKGKEQNFFFYSGLFYIFLGVPFLYSLLLYGAIGSILVGFLFLFLSRKNIPVIVQVLAAFFPICFVGYFIWGGESSNNIFLIPKGYVGRIVIVHGCKEGMSREYEGTYRVYRIGKDGLLKTKFSFAGNAFDALHSKYFYIDENGNREVIDEGAKDQIHPHSLWSLSYEKKGETVIDFILDKPIEDPYTYKIEENQKWQREIDSCAK